MPFSIPTGPPFAAVPRRLLLAVALGTLLVSTLAATIYLTAGAAGGDHALRGLPLDDAWIHQVYARSLAAGQPFQYNPGEWETGSTSPLWAILLAPGVLLGLGPVVGAKALGILCAAAAGLVGFRLATRLGDRPAGIAFALLLPLTPYFSFASVSGTEVLLFVALLLVVADRAAAGRWGWAGALCGLAILARPEGYLLLPLLAVAALAGRTGSPAGVSARWPRAGRALAAAAAVNAPWILYCLWATGRPLPATFYAKAAWFGLLDPAQLRKIAGVIFWEPFLGSTLPGAGWVAAGTILGLAALALGTARLARAGAAPLLLLGLFPWLFFWALSAELPMGPVEAVDFPGSVRTFYFARYLLPGLGPLLLTWLLGLADAARRAVRRVRAREATGWGLAVAVALQVGLALAAAVHQHRLLRDVYSWNCRNIDEVNVASGQWIAAHVPEGAAVAVSDAGASRYFGGHRVIDLVGLNSHRLLPLLAAIDRTAPGSLEEAALRERFWAEEHPAVLAITRHWHAPLLPGREYRLLATFGMEKNTIFGGEDLLVLQSVNHAPASGELPTGG